LEFLKFFKDVGNGSTAAVGVEGIGNRRHQNEQELIAFTNALSKLFKSQSLRRNRSSFDKLHDFITLFGIIQKTAVTQNIDGEHVFIIKSLLKSYRVDSEQSYRPMMILNVRPTISKIL
jgi:hypothetical protein